MSDASRQLEAIIGDYITGNNTNHYAKAMSGDNSSDITQIIPNVSGNSLLDDLVVSPMSGGGSLEIALASAAPSGTSFSTFTETTGTDYARATTDDLGGSYAFQWVPVIKVGSFAGDDFGLHADTSATVSGNGSNTLSSLKTTFVDSSAGEIVFGAESYYPDGMGLDEAETLEDDTSGGTCVTAWASMVTPVYTNANDISFPTAGSGGWDDSTHAIICFNDSTYDFPLIKCAFDSPVSVVDTETLTIKAGKLRFSIA